MPSAYFTFSPELTFFLAPGNREGSLFVAFEAGQSLKHLIEAAGVPHTEVGKVTLDGSAAAASDLARDGDQAAVFANTPGQGMPPGEPRFVLDNHLGRLAAYLRMFGFDCTYRNDFQDEELAQISQQEERILLTRDRRLLMRRAVAYGYCPRSLNSQRQAAEVLRRYQLNGQATPFHRCLRCNALLEPVSKEAVLDRLAPLTRRYYDKFNRCPACGQIYWEGSHYERMLSLIASIDRNRNL